MNETMRLTIEFERADCPQLYDDLERIPKGHRRTGRLRLLAVLGLQSENPHRTVSAPVVPVTAPVPVDAASAAADLFGSANLGGQDG